EGRADHGAVEPLVPLARMALGRPLAHSGDVGDGVVHRLGRGGDVAGDLDPVRHGAESTTGAPLRQPIRYVSRRAAAFSRSVWYAALKSAPPVDMRRTPSSARRSTGGVPGRARTLTGMPVSSTTRRMSASSTSPGA